MCYNSYRTFLTKRFGMPVLRVPLNAGFTCPNRDGATSSLGCTFCDNASFSPAVTAAGSVVSQLERAMAASRRFRAFIPYLQPFSNTYGSVELLKSIYEPLVSHPGVVGLAVGTRPDCLPAATMDYLRDVASRTHVCVELGLQSAHDATLQIVNRGHSVGDFVAAALGLARRGIYCAAHVILGLPGETVEMMQATARQLARLPVNGVKIHQLMIVKGTPLERELGRGALQPLSLEQYARALGAFLARLRPDQHIHRIVAQPVAAQYLVAPGWAADKVSSVSYLREYLRSHGIRQGTDCHSAPDAAEAFSSGTP